MMKKVENNSSFRIRLFVVSFTFVILLGLIIARLYYWQIVHANDFASANIQQQSFSTTILASRGLIKSSDGVYMAVNQITYTVYLYLPNVKGLESTVNQISTIAKVDPNNIDKILETNNSIKYMPVIYNVSDSVANKLIAENIAGVNVVQNANRSYPNGALLSQVLGFMGYDKYGNLKGLYGLEQYYNGDLSGQNGVVSGKEGTSKTSIQDQNVNLVTAQQGRNLTLTINSGIQQMVEAALKAGVDNTKSRMGVAIVQDPKTGAIIAMASYPTYDPNTYYNGLNVDCNLPEFSDNSKCNTKSDNTITQSCSNPVEQNGAQVCISENLNANNGSNDAQAQLNSYDNPAISFLYEPGSVMKLVTASAALDSGKVDPTTIINATPVFVEANGAKIYNYNKEALGNATLGQILQHSSNVGASLVSDMLGNQTLYNYTKAFGFGALTNIDLEGEETSIIPNYSTWLKINLYTASFGQYFSATPLQVTSMVSTIANGGIKMKPYVVSSLSDSTGTDNISPQSEGRVISQKAASELSQMMVLATTLEPAYGLKPIKEYMPIIASKTGSAQVPLKDQAGFDTSNINATYVGFAPADNPQFTLYVMLEYPQTGLYASTTAVPVWESIAKNLLVDYKISPND